MSYLRDETRVRLRRLGAALGAAAQAVVEAAGGSVTTLDGLPLRYNERDTLLNPHFLAYGDASRHWHKLF